MNQKASSLVHPAMPYARLLGRVVEHRRKELQLHQAHVANALAITQSAYSRLELGESPMTVNHLRAIAAVLRTTPVKLLSDAENYSAELSTQGVEITDGKKEDLPMGAILIALGILAALIAARGQ